MDIEQTRIQKLRRFEEEKENYKFKYSDIYNEKIAEFNNAMEFKGSPELQQIKMDLNKNISDINNQMSKAELERNKLEENLKFEDAEKKENIIAAFQEEKEKLNRRLNIVKDKINKEKEIKIKNVYKGLQESAKNYKEELQNIIDDARTNLKERYQKILEEQAHFNENYSPIAYKITEVESNINKLERYIQRGVV